MCGIAGIHRRVDEPKGDLARMAKQLLLGIEHRGTDATGVLCAFDDGDWWLRKDVVKAKKFVRKGRNYARNSRTAILHTRWATKGSPWAVRNAHPITDAKGKVAVVHNGVLWNDDEIFEAFGLARVAEVDSEAIPALIEYAGWDGVKDALALIDGSMAIAAVHRDHPGDLILARSDSSPLHYIVTDELVVWASTEACVQKAFVAAGLRKPGKNRIKYMPQMHMMRVNGEVGPLERFAPDPQPYWYYSTGSGISKTWDEQAWGKTKGTASSQGALPKDKTNPDRLWTPAWEGLKRGSTRQEIATRALTTPSEDVPRWSVHEDIAIDVLIAEGYTYDTAVDEVLKHGWEIAGLSIEEMDLIEDGEWEGKADYCLGDCGDCSPTCADLTRAVRDRERRATITTIGDAAIARHELKRKATAGLDTQ